MTMYVPYLTLADTMSARVGDGAEESTIPLLDYNAANTVNHNK